MRHTERTLRIARKANRDITFPGATPWLTFSDYTNDLDTSVDYVRECMRAFNQHLASLSPVSALKELQTVQLGRQCMQWMMSSGQHVRDACGFDFEFLRLFAHFLVAEDQDRTLAVIVRKRICAEYPERRPRLSPQKLPPQDTWTYHWYGRLLRSIIEAKLHRSVNNSAMPPCKHFSSSRSLEEESITAERPQWRLQWLQ